MSGSSARNHYVEEGVDQSSGRETTTVASLRRHRPGQLLTEHEVAELLGCSVFTVRRERKRERIAYHMYSRQRIYYSLEDVLAYQQSVRVSASSPSSGQGNNVVASACANESWRGAASDLFAAQAILNRRKVK